jgi:histidine triad (HIT) family protein
LVRGHVLIIPKIEIDKFFDIPDDYLSEMLFSHNTNCKAIEKVFIAIVAV